MKVLYLDRSSGISGDMLVGALCDLGVKPSALEWELSKLDLGDFHMHFEKKAVGDLEGIRFTIHEGSTHTHEQDEDDHGHDHRHTHVHADGAVCHHDHSHEEHGDHAEAAHAHSHEHEEHEHSHEEHDHHHSHEEHEHSHAHASEHAHEHSHHEHGRSIEEVQELISASDLSPFIKEHAVAIFGRLGGAAGDSLTTLAPIAEVICTCVALKALGLESFHIPAIAEDHVSNLGDAIVAEFGNPTETNPAHGRVGYGAGSESTLLQAHLCDLVEA